METNEFKNLEQLQKITARYFHNSKSANDNVEANTTQIKFVNYSELGSVITDMLKLCILALNQNRYENSETGINVGLILETVLQIFPVDEFEFLSEISQMVATSSHPANE
ncbi:hypothetical protein B0A80_11285 [Flavobacterium tructae]|uniref:hypothetical protein n=1 Tax=Flavobacterium tructae TaxID=1114873 RepID=UPI000B5B6FEC|nr:hypothetical protein [Flavobacterium tructae]OXB23517.1 hypothetical protein B0A80_11285 [Flavobacterium tructae]